MALLVTSLVAWSVMAASGSAPLVSAAGPPVQSLVSARLADTRPGQTTIDGQAAGIGRRTAHTSTEIKIAGRGGVPTDASAVAINLTSVQPSAPTYLTAYPCGTQEPPNASTVNSPPWIDRANSAFVKLSNQGTICIYTEAEGDFIIDVNGYVPTNGTPTIITPARLLDTRPNQHTIDGQYNGIGPINNESFIKVQIAGRGGVPTNATAAIFNLTAEFPDATTYLTAYPCDGSKPKDSSSLNLPTRDTRANNVFVKLSADGSVCIYTIARTSVLIDITGYTTNTDSPTSVNPVRLADSRPGEHTIDGQYLGFGRRGTASETPIQIAGRGGVPTNATAAIINLTADKSQDGTYLTAYPCGTPRPDPGSNLNLPAHDTAANSILVKLNTNGQVCIYTVAPTDIIIDINGYTAPGPVVPTLNCGAVSIPAAECQALVAIYNNGNGPNWVTKTNWLTPTDPCTWYGVGCAGGHVTQIDLSKNQVAGNLPAEVGNLASLISLDLSYDALTAIPPEIGRLTRLTSLKLTANRLSSLPTQIGTLASLKHLDVSYNKLEALPTQIGSLLQLSSLWCSGNQLRSIPTDIGKAKGLNSLLLNDNKLQGLPTQIDSLTNLTQLWLHNNEIKVLPDGIGSLRNLTELLLHQNQLDAIPPTFGNLTKLTQLDLANNSIKALPETIKSLTSLTKIQLNNNKLTALPVAIGKLTKVTELIAYDNDLKTLPTQIGDMSGLTTLDLHGNALVTVPSTIGQLKALIKLELGANLINVLPKQIGDVTNLQELGLSDNALTALPTELGNLSKLTRLGLSNNSLKAQPTQIGNLKRLVQLDMSNSGSGIAGDITKLFTPLMNANTITSLDLYSTACLSTTSTALAAWLTAREPYWKGRNCR